MIHYYVYPGIPNSITEVVANSCGWSAEALFTKCRVPELVRTRNIAVLAYKLKGLRVSDIAKKMGYKSHASAIHAIEKIKTDLQTDKNYRQEVGRVMVRLQLEKKYNNYIQSIKKEFWR